MAGQETSLLHQLARLYGVEINYYDGMGRLRQATEHSLLAILRALGAPVDELRDVESALREYRQEQWRRCCEPVVVAWDDEPACLELNFPVDRADGLAECRLELESGEERCWTIDITRLSVVQVTVVEDVGYMVKQLVLPVYLPWGYHRFQLIRTNLSCETLIIVAPRRAHGANRIWGGFLPLYALHSQRSLGTGDLTDLENLLRWIQELGGDIIGTLPLLAAFMDEPFNPSPYAPVSRLFWNELYLDVTRIPEFERCPHAQSLLNSAAFRKEIEILNTAPLVDYRRVMAAKRKILKHLARCCFAEDSERQKALWSWVRDYPAAQDYARFRAAVEAQKAGWPVWPERMRDGTLRQGDYDPEVERYHLYVQWVAREQLQTLSQRHRDGLYLDLPLGVDSAGYDVWRERTVFSLEVSTGAPPDAFFTRGQDWGFSPLHPERIREQGYRYFIACLRHHMQYAGVLRLDHVAGLQRLFWVPKDLGPCEGIYVRYRAEEFYAILTLESHRHKTALVGEDLGTVPSSVRTAMDRHNVYRMYILPFQQQGGGGLNSVPTDSLASLNTHDMPPFSSFWAERDAGDRMSLVTFLKEEGWLETENVNVEAVLRACLKYLAASPARILLVNLEDLWLEMAPQNVPGTIDEHPNWRRKARCTLETLSQAPRCVEILREVSRLRQSRPVVTPEITI